MNIQTRKDLTNYLQACLVKQVSQETESSDEEFPSKSLKSYILESNIDNFEKIFLDKFDMKVLSTKDETIKIISVTEKQTKKKIRFYVDLLDKRFLVFHSADESKLTDEFIESLISKDSNSLDYPWFFNGFMNNVLSFGLNESFSVRFRNEFYNIEKELAEIKRFSMRFWGNDGKKTLNQISKIDSLKQGISLSNVGVKIGNEDLFISDNVNYKGRFTAISGNSVKEHLYLINRIKSSYRDIINKIESSSIEYISHENKVSIIGEPIIIKFSKKILDIKSFSNILTSSKKPFRLWGISNFLSDNYVAINGIDLHTGDKIDFEISSEWIRLYLPKGSCGNVIVRLLTNIQHYFDSNAKIIIGGQEINDY
jgi:hypothetical protein